MRYGIFSGNAGYPTDMRNTCGNIDLRPGECSDCPADMRKLSFRNDLRSRLILATAMSRARASFVLSVSLGDDSPTRARVG
jgi:hypothetical protein